MYIPIYTDMNMNILISKVLKSESERIPLSFLYLR
jgi:hypothetical protein